MSSFRCRVILARRIYLRRRKSCRRGSSNGCDGSVTISDNDDLVNEENDYYNKYSCVEEGFHLNYLFVSMSIKMIFHLTIIQNIPNDAFIQFLFLFNVAIY